MKEKAYLFGPFIGSAFWEFFRFAPYTIYLKKKNPDVKIIILTRPSRFDFYGKYSDILIPLKIEDNKSTQDCFKSSDISISNYNKLKESFNKSYKERFEIIDHFCPDISHFRYKVKWQFPRQYMNYDFNPRQKNIDIINNIDSTASVLIDLSWLNDNDLKKTLLNELNEDNINYLDYEEFLKYIPEDLNDNEYSHYGCLISLIKNMSLVIGNIKESIPTKLSLLLKTSVITINESLSLDSISLINPMNTSVKFYEKEEVK